MPKLPSLKLEPPEIKAFKTFELNVRRYSAKRREYKKTYSDAYVAVLGGKVIASAKDLDTLLRSLKEQGRDLSPVMIDHLSDKFKLILSRS